jgi:hypothetical protein
MTDWVHSSKIKTDAFSKLKNLKYTGYTVPKKPINKFSNNETIQNLLSTMSEMTNSFDEELEEERYNNDISDTTNVNNVRDKWWEDNNDNEASADDGYDNRCAGYNDFPNDIPNVSKIEPQESSKIESKTEQTQEEPNKDFIYEDYSDLEKISQEELKYIKEKKGAMFESPFASMYLYPENVSINEDLIIFYLNTDKQRTFIPKKNQNQKFYCCFYDSSSDIIFGGHVVYSNISFNVQLSSEKTNINFIIFKTIGEIKKHERTSPATTPES